MPGTGDGFAQSTTTNSRTQGTGTNTPLKSSRVQKDYEYSNHSLEEIQTELASMRSKYERDRQTENDSESDKTFGSEARKLEILQLKRAKKLRQH